jgi:hypothetical protein
MNQCCVALDVVTVTNIQGNAIIPTDQISLIACHYNQQGKVTCADSLKDTTNLADDAPMTLGAYEITLICIFVFQIIFCVLICLWTRV